MASQKSKTAVIIGVGILVAALFFGGIVFFVFKAMVRAAQAKELTELKENNPVEYYVLHTPLQQNQDDLRRSLVGTWELMGARSSMTGEFTRLSSPQNFHKTFTLTNWAIVTYDYNSNVLYSASGHYTLQGELYTESIEAATGAMTKYLGKHAKFKIRVDGDTYYQMGAGKNPSIEEMWQRTEP
ncbi:MAG TPA: hypothetical protein VMB22_01215 [Verrucomicrobiae bacterium]|nr:hypothetical protein [Verrucomicrobiae bacterium]